jgi:hypothetical protein
MSGLNGRGLTYNLPNYHGPLLNVTPEDTPFLTAIGGLQQGGDLVQATEFEWQFYDLRTPAQNTKIEGADAPTPENRVRFNAGNVVEVHQEAVDVSYTKQAATGQRSGANVVQADDQVVNELAFQISAQLKQIKRDFAYSCLRGAYVKPSDNTTARQTRGLLNAITTNVIVKVSTPDPTAKDIIDLLQMVYDNGGISEQETATLLVGSTMKRWITKLFIQDRGYLEQSRNVGGITAQTIETDFGRLNVMLDRLMPAGQVAVASLEECEPVFLEIPGKGLLFVEPLAKTGASDKAQLYGEMGLKYGNERKHGKITGFGTTPPAA